MDSFIEKVLLCHEEIVELCEKIGSEITEEYKDKQPVIIGLLKGSVPFLAELIKHIKCPLEIDFMDVSSYRGAMSTGAVTILKDIETSIKGRHVILVEDIVDTGLTIQEVINLLDKRGAASIELCTLLDKPGGRTVKCMQARWVGLTINPEFVVGFGLDYNELYRNLDYVGVLKRSVYEK